MSYYTIKSSIVSISYPNVQNYRAASFVTTPNEVQSLRNTKMGSFSFHALIEVRWMTQRDYQLKNNPIITKKMYGVYEVAKY